MAFRDGNAVSPFDAKFQFSEQAWKRGAIDKTSAPVFPLRPDVRSGEQSAPTAYNIIGLDDISLLLQTRNLRCLLMRLPLHLHSIVSLRKDRRWINRRYRRAGRFGKRIINTSFLRFIMD